MKRYPGEMEEVAGMVIFNFGGERSGRDLNCQSALTELIDWKPIKARRIFCVNVGMTVLSGIVLDTWDEQC